MNERLRGSLRRRAGPAGLAVLLLVIAAVAATSVLADNTDQNNNQSRFAWGENTGWLKARPASEPYGAGGSGIDVTDTGLTGYLWGENIGWVSMSCTNDGSCGTNNWGVKNDGAGHLSGFAWSENKGWINFSCSNDGTCGGAAGNWGVSIAVPTGFDYLPNWGVFHGEAWGENSGWIRFNCTDDGSCGSVAYKAQTGWPDSDGDGYTDTQEAALSKSKFVFCPIMRADVNGDGIVSINDLGKLALFFGQHIPPASSRYDQNSDGKVTVNDFGKQALVFGQHVASCP